MTRSARTRRSAAVALIVALLTTLLVLVATDRATAAPLHPEYEMFDAINDERVAHGLEPVKMSLYASDVAEAWSLQMASSGYLSHNPNYVEEILPYVTDWTWMAENVGYGPSITELHTALMNSPGHRLNILSEHNKYVGIGVVFHQGMYWITQNFIGTNGEMVEATRPAPTTTTTTQPTTTTTTQPTTTTTTQPTTTTTWPTTTTTQPPFNPPPLAPPAPPAPTFADVPGNAYYAGAVAWAAKNKVTTGCATNRFCPNEPTTRAQMVTLLWRYLGSPKAPRPAPFADVPRGSYYAPAVDWAYASGVTTGCASNRFCPNEGVLRAQMVTFLYRAKGSPAASASNKFRDVSSNAYFAKAVTWADRQGITTGCASDRFCPNEITTRAQGITFVHRYAGR